MTGRSKTKGKEPVVLTPSQEAELKEYKRNWAKAIEELGRIVDADSAGTILPFKMRKDQRGLFDTIQRVRSINIYLSLEAHYEDWKDLLRIALKTSTLPEKPSQIIECIFEARPEQILGVLKEDLSLDKVTDGPVLIIVGKPRQIGVSTLIEVIMLLFLLFNPRSNGLVLSLDDDSAENVVDLLSKLIEFWPEEKSYLKPEIDRNSGDYIKFASLSEVTVRTAEGAQIRSFKQDIIHGTEVAHYKNSEKIGAALAAIRSHAWVFLESTANGPKGAFYKRYKTAKSVKDLYALLDNNKSIPGRSYVKWFSDWVSHEAYSTRLSENEDLEIMASLTPVEKALFDRFPTQMTLGKIKWRREKILNDCVDQKTLTPEQFFMQEFPADESEMFQQKSSAVFDISKINDLEIETKTRSPYLFSFPSEHAMPERVLHENLANLFIWEEPKPGASYIISGDLSQGRGLDYSVLDVYDRTDGTALVQVAQFRENKLNQTTVAHIGVMLQELYNDAFFIWEANNSGEFTATVINVCHKYNVYFRQSPNSVDKSPSMIPGINTNASMKTTLIEKAKAHIADKRLLLRSQTTIHEMKMFAYNGCGRR
jgi:hypothetical protein